MNELVFEVTQETDGGLCAEGLSENIFTQGDMWEDLRRNVQQAVRRFYFDRPKSQRRVRLHSGSSLKSQARFGVAPALLSEQTPAA